MTLSECNFGETNNLRSIHEGVIAVSSVSGALLQGYEGHLAIGATAVELEQGIHYLYVAQHNGTIMKVKSVSLECKNVALVLVIPIRCVNQCLGLLKGINCYTSISNMGGSRTGSYFDQIIATNNPLIGGGY